MPRLESPYMRAEEQPGVRPWWQIRNRRHGDLLGAVGWYSAWQQYVFLPGEYVVLSADCMAALARFATEAKAEAKVTA